MNREEYENGKKELILLIEERIIKISSCEERESYFRLLVSLYESTYEGRFGSGYIIRRGLVDGWDIDKKLSEKIFEYLKRF
ncbi:hypothetical protein EP331_00570 [bacterium]|nr:MAG: hypothetical protein EP331_00570 [bacterium]